MRAALLTVVIGAVLILALSNAWAVFNCFDTPQGERRCACIGGDNCIQMQKSGSCKSGFKCDDSELGSMICSCKAGPVPARRKKMAGLGSNPIAANGTEAR